MCLFNIIFSCCLLINQNLRLRSIEKIRKYKIKSENQNPKALLIALFSSDKPWPIGAKFWYFKQI
jgi:hypothetical protein